jgi:hypothetical protein
VQKIQRLLADPATILGLSYVGGKGIELVSEFVKEIFKPSATVIGRTGAAAESLAETPPSPT